VTRILVGTAGWSLPKAEQPAFPPGGSHLARYAARFPVAEINSSFHRPHRASTWARWAAETPDDFRFSAKIPKSITHVRRLADAGAPLDTFLSEAAGLGEKLACLLVQLPPSLALDEPVAHAFFADLRARTAVAVACEPRHPTWFAADADAMLAELGIARVAADPARVPAAAEPGGARDLVYHRLHGSPRMYYSAYGDDFLADLAARMRADAATAREVWCVFDNTAAGAATRNALDLSAALAEAG